MRVDLHLHTYYSDGVYSPSEVVMKAKENGLDVISIVDHDTTDGLEEAIETGKEIGVEVIPGIELSSSINGTDIHILGYFINWRDENFQVYLKVFRELRSLRAKRIIEKLNALGISLKFENVVEIAKYSPISRVHIASALVRYGFVNDFHEAFSKYLNPGCPAYEKNIDLSPRKAIKLIADVGGLSFIAHPAKFISENDLASLIELGIDGIEVIHPSHNEELVRYYRSIANEYFLLESGGSDFHGGLRQDERCIGAYTVPYKFVETMKQRLNLK
ncbi:MAG: PHP domain-containing protein [Candidatus Kryptonium sp.]|nr:PHP domain-containing protein [Candidatus Kryptonium sp.]